MKCRKINLNIFLIFIIALIIVFIISIIMGRYSINISDLIYLLKLKILNLPLGEYKEIDTIIFKIRLPRILASILIGSSLAVSGTTYQSIFRNPMVSPDVLGAANGAGFGAAAGILLGFGYWGVQISAFAFGILAVFITYMLSTALKKRGDPILMLVLSGIIIGSIFSSLISLTKYIADPDDTLPAITFWLMGSLSSIKFKDVLLLTIPVSIGIIPLIIFRNKLNIMAFGDQEAQSMGIDVNKSRTLFIICSTIITAASVSLCGMVGWVGLIIPHITRSIVGSNHNKLIMSSVFTGAIYLMLVDDLSRTLFSVEIPLGIITSLIGAPFFIYLLFQKRRAW